jgi:hypothetical protein
MAKLSVGISLNVDSTQTLGAAEFLKLRGETCICAVACIIEYILLRFSILGKSVGPQDWVCCHYYNMHPVLALQLCVFCIFSFLMENLG